MAADFLVISRTSRPQMGAEIIAAANLMVDLRDRVRALNSSAGHMFNGGDYSVFEAQTGITTGQGANAMTLLGLINTILNSNTDVTGANRLAQLDEFAARVAGQ